MCQIYDLFLVIHIHAGRGSCFVKSVRGLHKGSKAIIMLEEAYPSSFSTSLCYVAFVIVFYIVSP